MNRPELEAILKKARLPEIPEESLEMFPRRMVAGIKRSYPPDPAARRFSPMPAWAFGLAACVTIAIAIAHWHKPLGPETLAENDSIANPKLIGEILAMFPNRVRAIVQDERGLNLVLSDNEDVPVSTPIYVRICDGRSGSSLVTFSGQEIQIAGQKVTVLSDAHGGIILTGKQFVWSNTERIGPGSNLKIEARNLGSMAM
jgi:hypothetical protein